MLAWKQPFIQRVRNSSLVERGRVDNNRASSTLPKTRVRDQVPGGRGALPVRRIRGSSRGGARGKANVGISNDNGGTNPHAGRPRVPDQR